MENHINELSTKYTNHLGDYAVQVSSMTYQHHKMLLDMLGSIPATDTTTETMREAGGLEKMTTYVLAAYNANWCPEQTFSVTTKAECEIATNQIGFSFQDDSVVYDDYPTGCFCKGDVNWMKCQWHTYENGHGRSDVQPLCRQMTNPCDTSGKVYFGDEVFGGRTMTSPEGCQQR